MTLGAAKTLPAVMGMGSPRAASSPRKSNCGIVAIVPAHRFIAVWSPELDRSGNSLAGTIALELFVRLTDLSTL
jgi:hypothetical protein